MSPRVHEGQDWSLTGNCSESSDSHSTPLASRNALAESPWLSAENAEPEGIPDSFRVGRVDDDAEFHFACVAFDGFDFRPTIP